MNGVALIILAAGLGTRMGAKRPKVLMPTGKLPMLVRLLQMVSKVGPDKIVIVTGHMGELVEEAVQEGARRELYSADAICFAKQVEQKGTGDAVRSALPELEGFEGEVVILYGDMPLVTDTTIQNLLDQHKREQATLTITTALTDLSSSFGKIIRNNETDSVEAIREVKECTPKELGIPEVNCGIYAVNSSFLYPAISGLDNNNSKGEYYLTDIVATAVKGGDRIATLRMQTTDEVQGANTRAELAQVNRVFHQRKITELINAGVNVVDTESIVIDEDASVASSVTIGPGVQILGKSVIGENVVIEGPAYIRDATIGPDVEVRFSSRIEGATVGARSLVGPFAHLRPDTKLDEDVKVGNFVEVKKCHLQAGAKASHLSYLGDAVIGEGANIGAGTITCNYDGTSKHQTTIKEKAFIGSNTALVAPVTIGSEATVGAGSVITKDVSDKSLALTRAKQIEKKNWSRK